MVDIMKDAVNFCQNVTAWFIILSYKSHFDINHCDNTLTILSNWCMSYLGDDNYLINSDFCAELFTRQYHHSYYCLCILNLTNSWLTSMLIIHSLGSPKMTKKVSMLQESYYFIVHGSILLLEWSLMQATFHRVKEAIVTIILITSMGITIVT